MKQEEEKCCGECCWFHGEMTDGEGLCAHNPMFNEFCNTCGSPACNDYVSRQEMRHHMYVLLATKYWFEGNPRHNVSPREIHDAFSFAYKYMKVFSKL